MTKGPEETEALRMRREAEERLRARAPDAMTESHESALLHDLQVHGIELEMQNEELRRARVQNDHLLARLTDLYDFAPVGYLTLSQDGTILEANLTGATLLGRDRGQLVEHPLSGCIQAPSRREFADFLHRTFQSGALETCVVSVGGAHAPQRWLQVDGTRSTAEECRVVLLDVSERRFLEAELLQMQKMEMVGRLAGGVAHDFNNMLTVIIGTADMALARTALDDPSRDDLEEIAAAGRRAATVTRQLLAFGRKQVMRSERLGLQTVVAGLQATLLRLLGEDVRIEVQASDQALVFADPAQLEAAIINLVLNARDAMPTGGTIRIETSDVVVDSSIRAAHPSLTPGPHARLSITDTGIGMNEATRAHIFEPFFTTKSVGKGTGLGLSMVDGIVRQSGGSVSVVSERGEGTRFDIYLPVVSGHEHEPATVVQSELPAGGDESVLIVEDEAIVRRLAGRILESAGYTVLAAVDGVDALALLSKSAGTVALMVTDVRMPRMGGVELASRVMEIRPAMRILFASGYGADDGTPANSLPADAPFLPKPYTARQLCQAVRRVLDTPDSALQAAPRSP